MSNGIDTRAKVGTPTKVASDLRLNLVRLGRRDVKYWHKRACGKCEESLFAISDFGSVAVSSRTDVMAKHDFCRKCRAKIRAEFERDPLFSDALDHFWRIYMPGLRSGAYARKLFVAIDADDVIGLHIKQRGLCAISGLELDTDTKGKSGRSNRAHLRPSVDRIDSNGNYTIDNIQIVAMTINLMKGTLPQSTFIEICGAIARHNLSL